MFSHYLLAARLSLFLSSPPPPHPYHCWQDCITTLFEKTWLIHCLSWNKHMVIWYGPRNREDFFFLQADSLFFLLDLRVGSELQMSKKSALGTVVSFWREDVWPAGAFSRCGGCSGTWTPLFPPGNVTIVFPLSPHASPPALWLERGSWGQPWGAQAGTSVPSFLDGEPANWALKCWVSFSHLPFKYLCTRPRGLLVAACGTFRSWRRHAGSWLVACRLSVCRAWDWTQATGTGAVTPLSLDHQGRPTLGFWPWFSDLVSTVAERRGRVWVPDKFQERKRKRKNKKYQVSNEIHSPGSNFFG